MNVKVLCIKVYNLLFEIGEFNWAKIFKSFIIELEESEDKSIYRKILAVYAGMGSFNDLILYKNGILCIDENDELSRLRNELYKEIVNKWI